MARATGVLTGLKLLQSAREKAAERGSMMGRTLIGAGYEPTGEMPGWTTPSQIQAGQRADVGKMLEIIMKSGGMGVAAPGVEPGVKPPVGRYDVEGKPPTKAEIKPTPSITYKDPTTGISIAIPGRSFTEARLAMEMPWEEKEALSELYDIQMKASDEGWSLEIDPNLSSQQQLESARAQYAEKVKEKPLEIEERLKTEAYEAYQRKGATPEQLSLLGIKPEEIDTKDEIIRKIAANEALTEGEQRVYNEIIVKPTKPKEPSWGQEQKIASIRAGLERGEVTIGREFGEPSTYPIKSIEDAYKAISDAGFDPILFTEELRRYRTIVIKDKRGRLFEIPHYQLQEAIERGYKVVE